DFQQVPNNSKNVATCQLTNIPLNQVFVVQTVTARCQSTSVGNEVADIRDLLINATGSASTRLPLTRQYSLLLGSQTYGIWTAQLNGPLYFRTGLFYASAQRLISTSDATRCD